MREAILRPRPLVCVLAPGRWGGVRGSSHRHVLRLQCGEKARGKHVTKCNSANDGVYLLGAATLKRDRHATVEMLGRATATVKIPPLSIKIAF